MGKGWKIPKELIIFVCNSLDDSHFLNNCDAIKQFLHCFDNTTRFTDRPFCERLIAGTGSGRRRSKVKEA